MSRSRRYREDLTYAEWHRLHLPQLYVRDGHRLDLADRDWTEFCTACKAPLVILEEVIDHGQDVFDKGISVTRNLAIRAGIPAYQLVVHVDRPRWVQDKIDQLGRHITRIESIFPIEGFSARRIAPDKPRRELHTFTPDEWAEEIRIWHRSHHAICPRANRMHILQPIDADLIGRVRRSSSIYDGTDDQLTFEEGA